MSRQTSCSRRSARAPPSRSARRPKPERFRAAEPVEGGRIRPHLPQAFPSGSPRLERYCRVAERRPHERNEPRAQTVLQRAGGHHGGPLGDPGRSGFLIAHQLSHPGPHQTTRSRSASAASPLAEGALPLGPTTRRAWREGPRRTALQRTRESAQGPACSAARHQSAPAGTLALFFVFAPVDSAAAWHRTMPAPYPDGRNSRHAALKCAKAKNYPIAPI
jgi:hypothetical protein